MSKQNPETRPAAAVEELEKRRRRKLERIQETTSDRDRAFSLNLSAAVNDVFEVEQMAAAGWDLNLRHCDFTAMQKAAQQGSTDVVRALVRLGVDVRAEVSIAPFLLACVNGHLETARVLAELGADVNGRNREDATALILAAQKGQMDVVKLLVELGVDGSLVDEKGYTAMRRAMDRADVPMVMELAKVPGAVDSAADMFGQTALMLAGMAGLVDHVQRLLAAGADVNKQASMHEKNDGRTALMTAVVGEQPHVVDILLEAGADVNAKMPSGTTAASLARSTGQPQLAAKLERLMAGEAGEAQEEEEGVRWWQCRCLR